MSSVVGVFANQRDVDSACRVLNDAGCSSARRVVLNPLNLDALSARMEIKGIALRHRGEAMLRAAVKWGIVAALVTEVPFLIVLLLLPVDLNVKVLMGATIWKFGGAFGAWIGAMSASDRGLDDEVAEEYEGRLREGKWVVAVDMGRKAVRHVRGTLLESGALEARDIRGTFELRRPWLAVNSGILK